MANGNAIIENLMVRNLLELFNEKDPSVRQTLLEELWADDSVFIDPEGAHHGREKIDKAIDWLFRSFPGFSFSTAGPVRSHHGVACLPWSYGPEESPKQITGIDIGVIEGGRLAALYTFIDGQGA